MSAYTYRHEAGAWSRHDDSGRFHLCAGRADVTPAHVTYPTGYDSRCAACWVGAPHTEAAHALELGAKAANVVWWYASSGIGLRYPAGIWGAAWPAGKCEALADELRRMGYPVRIGCKANGAPEGLPTVDELRAVNEVCGAPIFPDAGFAYGECRLCAKTTNPGVDYCAACVDQNGVFS